MKITSKDTFIILEDERDDILDFATYLEGVIPLEYSQNNIIVDLLKYDTLPLEQLLLFLKLSNAHRANKKSFVFVNIAVNFNLIPDEIIVVPTIQEAEDIISMEEIERDLGF